MNKEEKLNLIETKIKNIIGRNRRLKKKNFALKSKNKVSKVYNDKTILKEKNNINNKRLVKKER
jgi:hypothetical protein